MTIKIVFLNILVWLLFAGGCALKQATISDSGTKLSGYSEKTVEKVEMLKKATSEGANVAWALSSSNWLIGLTIILALVCAGAAVVTRLKTLWALCIVCIIATVGIVLLPIISAAMMKYLWAVALISIIAVVLGLGFLTIKLYMVAKEAFVYGENIKKEVTPDILTKVGDVAKASQPLFVRNMIKWLRVT